RPERGGVKVAQDPALLFLGDLGALAVPSCLIRFHRLNSFLTSPPAMVGRGGPSGAGGLIGRERLCAYRGCTPVRNLPPRWHCSRPRRMRRKRRSSATRSPR